MKSDLEKMRDVQEQIHGANTGLRYSSASRAGAGMAERARGPVLPFRPPQKKKPVPIITPTRMTAREERETLALIGAGSTPWWKPGGRMLDQALAILLVIVATCGAWYGAFKLGDDLASLPVRAIIGAIAAPSVLAAAAILAIGVLRALVETVIPALIRLAIIGGAVYLLLLFLSGQL